MQLTAQLAAGSDYVLMASIIGTSGYDLKGTGTPQGVLQKVQNFHRFSSRQLAVNQLKLKWKKPLNVTTPSNVQDYKILRSATVDFTTAVEIGATTTTSFVVSNITSAPQTWTFWVVAFNSAGPGVPSDPITVTMLNA